MSTPSPTKPLATRDVNTSSPSPTKLKAEKPATEKEDANKPMSMEYHRQVLQSRLDEEKSNQKYVSPSDTIMSPCTAKLSAYKSKHFMKAKPQQSLFAKMEASKKMAGAVKSDEEKGGKDGVS